MNGKASTTLDLHRVLEQTWIDQIHFLEEVDSTNEVALQQARSTDTNLSELFITENQRRGRGRGDNRWWSAAGALTFSVLLPELPLNQERIPQVSLTVGVALCRALGPYVPEAELKIKWPNDVFLQQRKVSGVLIELPARRPPRLVIGVGVNVNNTIAQAPAAVRRSGTSLIDATGRQVDRTAVLIDCLTQMARTMQMLLTDDPELPGEWRHYSLLTGQWLRLDVPHGEITGTCQSIADDGSLVVKSDAPGTLGIQQTCGSGVVTEFRPVV